MIFGLAVGSPCIYRSVVNTDCSRAPVGHRKKTRSVDAVYEWTVVLSKRARRTTIGDRNIARR